MIVPVLTIVGDTDEEIARGRDAARMSLSFYGSTPNYAFIWDEAGFEGTTARIREKQKAGDFAGMAAEISDDHLAVFATESTWDALAGDLVAKYGDIGRPPRVLQRGRRHARAIRALRRGGEGHLRRG